MNELVVTEDLSKIYEIGKVEYPALRNLDLTFHRGEFAAVTGPSGSGKSTLLHVVGGLDKPTSGRVLVDGSDLSKLSSGELAEYRNRKIGFIFQFFNLIQYLTAIENVELTMSIAGVDPRARKAKARRLLEMFGLQEMATKKPNELSGGERQRVAIARALINEPDLVLADEPTGNIDSESAGVVVNAFRRLVDGEGVSVVMVTHNVELTRFCDRVIRLKDGRLDRVEVTAK